MVRVVITGGFGFIGQEVCKTLLAQSVLGGEDIREILLVDVVLPDPLPDFCADERVRTLRGSCEDMETCRSLLSGDANQQTSVFHFAGVMSGTGEKDFDLCIRANLGATQNLLETARQRHADGFPLVRFVFTSSGATFGETKDCPVGDTTKLVPTNTYGMTKACCEMLVNDYSRRGFVDGRTARLPTVIVRPGQPNAATTSIYSGVLREPLHGVDVEIPIERHLAHAVTSTRAVVKNLVLLHEAVWPDIVDRAVNLPSISITLQELVDGLYRVVDPEDYGKLGKISDKIDPFLNGVVGGMALKQMAHERALSLGLVEVPTVDTIIREFLQDYGGGAVVQAAPLTDVQPVMSPAERRVAVVTGAGSGIGQISALALMVKAGFNTLVLVGRRREALEQTRSALMTAALAGGGGGNAKEILMFVCDITVEADVVRLFAEVETKFGRCDLVFNNAGCGAPPVPMEDLPLEKWQQCFDVNVTGSFLCCREAFRLMKKQVPRGGRIINNGSVSSERPRLNSCAYTASKHAVKGLTKSAALDGRAFDIACGQIDVGNALTEMSVGLTKGALQANGEIVAEAVMDVRNVGDAVAYMAGLPLNANVLNMTVMATQMPLVGRG